MSNKAVNAIFSAGRESTACATSKNRALLQIRRLEKQEATAIQQPYSTSKIRLPKFY